MKERVFFWVFVNLCVMAFFGVLRAEEDMNFQDVTLRVAVPGEIYLGKDVVIDLTLESKSEQSLYSLETANLLIVVERMNGSKKKYVCNRGRVRQIKQTLSDGKDLVETIKIKKQLITIGEDSSSRLTLTLLKDFSTRLSCGTYNVSAVYEGEVKATNATFAVVVDSVRSVPALIDLVADSDEWTRGWARDRLFSIVGQPAWKPSRADPEERIDSEVAALRKWWKDKKDLILRNESSSKQVKCPETIMQ